MKGISTGTLKGITALFLIFGFGLMLAGPWVVRRPTSMPRKTYARRAATYVGGFLIAITGAGFGAFFLIRRAREEYRVQSMENLREMLEAARIDQLKKSAEEQAPSKSLMGTPLEIPPDSETLDDA